VITRVGPVHLEFFPSERAIAEEKAVLAAAVPAAGFVVLCPDEPWFDVLRTATRARVVTISMEGPADYAATPAAPDGAIRIRERDGLEWICPVPIPGRPARLNALRAVAVGRESGVAPADIADALASFRPPSMRWAEETAGGVRWINDAYNANPVSLAAALDTFAELPVAGAKWLVLGGMHELGAGGERFHRDLGAAVAGGPWAGLVTVGEGAVPYAEGAVDAGWPGDRTHRCDSAAAAAAVLRDRLRPGDAVLLKGSRAERIEEVLNDWRKTAGAAAPAAAAAGG
jgi:UDP-N-acetylmuramoyl-tripeptide--D-alanyl-D-alanine ligase